MSVFTKKQEKDLLSRVRRYLRAFDGAVASDLKGIYLSSSTVEDSDSGPITWLEVQVCNQDDELLTIIDVGLLADRRRKAYMVWRA